MCYRTRVRNQLHVDQYYSNLSYRWGNYKIPVYIIYKFTTSTFFLTVLLKMQPGFAKVQKVFRFLNMILTDI